MALSQKALSTKRCIKTPASEHKGAPSHRQKAPSAKRCIKTGFACVVIDGVICNVRKHRAPKGALRRDVLKCFRVLVRVMSESTEYHTVH